jgi:hypothetical protein
MSLSSLTVGPLRDLGALAYAPKAKLLVNDPNKSDENEEESKNKVKMVRNSDLLLLNIYLFNRKNKTCINNVTN